MPFIPPGPGRPGQRKAKPWRIHPRRPVYRTAPRRFSNWLANWPMRLGPTNTHRVMKPCNRLRQGGSRYFQQSSKWEKHSPPNQTPLRIGFEKLAECRNGLTTRHGNTAWPMFCFGSTATDSFVSKKKAGHFLMIWQPIRMRLRSSMSSQCFRYWIDILRRRRAMLHFWKWSAMKSSTRPTRSGSSLPKGTHLRRWPGWFAASSGWKQVNDFRCFSTWRQMPRIKPPAYCKQN